MMVNTIWKAWKISASTPLYLPAEMKLLPRILLHEIIHQHINRLPSIITLVGLVTVVVSCFSSKQMIWTQSARSISSALQLSLCQEAGSVFPSAICREAGHIRRRDCIWLRCTWYEIFEDSLPTPNQLGQRQGAGVVYLNVFHPDIIAFLSTKKNADEKFGLRPLTRYLSFG